jgi:hypothetical protein
MDFPNALLTNVGDEFLPNWPEERPAAVLGLAPNEADPVRIILTAHLRLRHCRRRQKADGRPIAISELRRIVRARDELLQQSLRQLASRVAGVGKAERHMSGASG